MPSFRLEGARLLAFATRWTCRVCPLPLANGMTLPTISTTGFLTVSDTETPVDIREQFTFDDACRVADGNELHGPPVLLPVDTVLDDHTGDADSFTVMVLQVG